MSLHLEHNGAVATLLVERPEKRNAFSLEMWQAIPALLDKAIAYHGVRVLVIRSADGGAFCAGADLLEMIANQDDKQWLAANQAAISAAQHQLARVDLPTVAWVQGDCIGGGCGLAMACDIRVASQKARFGVTPAKLGLVYPLHDVKLLVDLVGPGQARRMLFTGSLISAEEAFSIGLVEQVVDDCAGLVENIAATSPASNRQLKRFVRRVLEGEGAEDTNSERIFSDAFQGPDFREGTAAFAAKRPPRFTD